MSDNNTEIQLYNEIPRKRNDVLKSLYDAYFHGFSGQTQQRIFAEINTYRELHPAADKTVIMQKLFQLPPLDSIPDLEKEIILAKFTDPHNAFFFIERNFKTYKKYFKKPDIQD